MKLLEKTFFSFTYGGDCVGLSAAKACIPKIKSKRVPEHLNNIGQILKEGINDLIYLYNLENYFCCIGYPCRSIFSFNGNGKFNELELKTYFQQELFRRGILWAAYHSLSFAHKKKDIYKTLNAFEDILKIFKNKFLEKNFKLKNSLEGKVVSPVFRKVSDFNSYMTNK